MQTMSATTLVLLALGTLSLATAASCGSGQDSSDGRENGAGSTSDAGADGTVGTPSIEVTVLATDLGDLPCIYLWGYEQFFPKTANYQGHPTAVFEVRSTGTATAHFDIEYEDTPSVDWVQGWEISVDNCNAGHCWLEPGESTRLSVASQRGCKLDGVEVGLRFTITAPTIPGFAAQTITAIGKTLEFHGKIDVEEFVFSQADFSKPLQYHNDCGGAEGRGYRSFTLTNGTRFPAPSALLICGSMGFGTGPCASTPSGPELFGVGLSAEWYTIIQPGQSVKGCILATGTSTNDAYNTSVYTGAYPAYDEHSSIVRIPVQLTYP